MAISHKCSFQIVSGYPNFFQKQVLMMTNIGDDKIKDFDEIQNLFYIYNLEEQFLNMRLSLLVWFETTVESHSYVYYIPHVLKGFVNAPNELTFSSFLSDLGTIVSLEKYNQKIFES